MMATKRWLLLLLYMQVDKHYAAHSVRLTLKTVDCGELRTIAEPIVSLHISCECTYDNFHINRLWYVYNSPHSATDILEKKLTLWFG